jgi:hypothetical protein
MKVFTASFIQSQPIIPESFHHFNRRLLLFVSVLSFAFFFSSCKNKPAIPKTKEELQATDTAHFYPLDVYFKEQIQYVDLRAFPLYRITTKDGKRDSAAISKDEFIALANTFLKHDIAAPAVKALYRETSFEDLTTGSLTLNYKPSDKNTPVQNIDVLMDQEGRMVKRVIIRAVYMKGDTTVTEMCSWKTNKSFQLNRSLETKTYNATELNFINWNDTQ